MLPLIAENGQGELSRRETGKNVQVSRERRIPADVRLSSYLSVPQRKKNFRQQLARTLEPGTLPEILVDVNRELGSVSTNSRRHQGAVSGPAHRIR